MTIAIRSAPLSRQPGSAVSTIANLVSGMRWGLEMSRRYDSEKLAGRRPDSDAIRRMAGEVDDWLEGRI